jgi:hypothetical protein
MNMGQSLTDTSVNLIINNIALITLFLSVSFLILLLIRELVTWYWKISRIVQLLEYIASKLGNIEQNTLDKK